VCGSGKKKKGPTMVCPNGHCSIELNCRTAIELRTTEGNHPLQMSMNKNVFAFHECPKAAPENISRAAGKRQAAIRMARAGYSLQAAQQPLQNGGSGTEHR